MSQPATHLPKTACICHADYIHTTHPAAATPTPQLRQQPAHRYAPVSVAAAPCDPKIPPRQPQFALPLHYRETCGPQQSQQTDGCLHGGNHRTSAARFHLSTCVFLGPGPLRFCSPRPPRRLSLKNSHTRSAPEKALIGAFSARRARDPGQP